MADLKLVIGVKEGKSYQKELKSPEADAFLKKRIGDNINGDEFGFPGYEFLITGGSDKCGFPMRKGIQFHRKKILTGQGVGFCGKDRNGKKQFGLVRRRTVCGERITSIIRQVNLKVVKAGAQPLGGEAATEPKSEE